MFRFMGRPKEIDVHSFGRVDVPMQVNREKGCLESVIEFGVKDVVNFIHSIWHYYSFKSDQTQRQKEITELTYKLEKLLKKEKSVEGLLWSPVSLEKD